MVGVSALTAPSCTALTRVAAGLRRGEAAAHRTLSRELRVCRTGQKFHQVAAAWSTREGAARRTLAGGLAPQRRIIESGAAGWSEPGGTGVERPYYAHRGEREGDGCRPVDRADAHLPRRHQVRAYHLRAALRVSGHGAGGARAARLAGPRQDHLDHAGDGWRADAGHGAEPADRRRRRRAKSADGEPRLAAPAAASPRDAALRACRGGAARGLGMAAQSAVLETGAGRARIPSRLLIYQTVHLALPSGAGADGRHRAGRRLAGGQSLAQPEQSAGAGAAGAGGGLLV